MACICNINVQICLTVMILSTENDMAKEATFTFPSAILFSKQDCTMNASIPQLLSYN